MTRLKHFGVSDPVAHSSMRADVPPLVPLRTTLNATTRPSTSRYSFTPAIHTNHHQMKPPVPNAFPINSMRSMNGGSSSSRSFLSASMMKQKDGGTSGFKGLDTVERMSRGHRMVSLARSKSPTPGFSNSVFNTAREKDDKRQYFELLKQVCPDIYWKAKRKCD